MPKMPRADSDLQPPHRKAAPSPYARNGKSETCKTSNKKEEGGKKEKGKENRSTKEDSTKIRNEINTEFPSIHLQSQEPPPKGDSKKNKKKKKKKRNSSINDSTLNGNSVSKSNLDEARTSEKSIGERMIEERIKKDQEEQEKLDLLNGRANSNDTNASLPVHAKSPSSSPVPESQTNGDRDIEMASQDNPPQLFPNSGSSISSGPKRRNHSSSPIKHNPLTKPPLITPKEGGKRRKREKETLSLLKAEQKAKEGDEDSKKQREEIERIAKENLEKIQNETERLRNESGKVKAELDKLQKQKKELEEMERTKKVKMDEDRKRQSDQELARIREERRKHKELQDRAEKAELDAQNWKVKCDEEISEREGREKEKLKVIENLQNSLEEGKEKIKSNETAITKHENTETAVIHALECPICLCTVDDPYVISCGHMACKGCLVNWFRSATALKHEYPGEITPDTDLSYRTKLCHVCRSTILRKPARAFFLRAVLEPLGLFEHKDPPTSQDPDPWTKIFPAERETYRIYDEFTEKCPECLSEIIDGVCPGCNIEFSDDGFDVEGFEEEEEDSVHGSELGSGDIIRIDGGPLNFIDDEAQHSSSSSSSSSSDSDSDSGSGSSDDSSDDEDGHQGRQRRQTAIRTGGAPGSQLNPRRRQAPPPPPPALNNILNILADGDDTYDSNEDDEEREPDSEDEYGGSFIDDEVDELDDDDGDVSMKDDLEGGSGSDEEEDQPRERRKTNRRADPDEDEDEPIFTGTRRRQGRGPTIVLSDSE